MSIPLPPELLATLHAHARRLAVLAERQEDLLESLVQSPQSGARDARVIA